jgi:hypothetical protein
MPSYAAYSSVTPRRQGPHSKQRNSGSLRKRGIVLVCCIVRPQLRQAGVVVPARLPDLCASLGERIARPRGNVMTRSHSHYFEEGMIAPCPI